MKLNLQGSGPGRKPLIVPAELWRDLRNDPLHAPEHVAKMAAKYHGPAAERWAARARRERFPPSPRQLARRARRRHVWAARVVGAGMGFGGAYAIVPDLAALAWIQSRMVFFIAAAYGHDPLDPNRPAELLVLQELYQDPAAARRALEGVGPSLVMAYAGKYISRRDALMRKLLKQVGQYGARRLAGKSVPGVAIAFNALDNGADTKRLARRTLRFYRP